MLVSPTEPLVLRQLGTVSSVPEKYGCDVFLATPLGTIGVQRKEVKDLVRSVHDGRLAKETAQIQQLSIAVMVIEGNWRWTKDGQSLTVHGWSRRGHRGLLLSLQSAGFWVETTDGLEDTIAFISELSRWAMKRQHVTTRTRPNPVSSWGEAGSRDWGCHLLQSFPSIGADTARAIYDHFNGVPLQWTCDLDGLLRVRGIGKKRAETLLKAFTNGDGQ